MRDQTRIQHGHGMVTIYYDSKSEDSKLQRFLRSERSADWYQRLVFIAGPISFQAFKMV